jgi:CSLREA domain-containing protein
MVKIFSTRILRIFLNLTLLTILLMPSSLGEAGGSGWFVNTVDDLDDGLCDAVHCSLREAINISNATAGQQMIAFDIPGPAPHIIELCNVLPAITDPAIVDGTLEPDYPYSGGPAVAIAASQGASCAPAPYGLWIEASDTVVRGVSVVGFDQPSAPITGGIVIHSGTGSTIESNYIGLLPGGSPLGNRNGILLGSAAHQVVENVVSGNTYGIHAFLGDQIIDRNYIGTDPDAMSTNLNLRNTIGVYIEPGADNNQIGLSGTGNVISGNGDGIYLGSQGNQIYSNMIGTNRTGTAALGNTIGIHAGQTTYTIIGGPDPALTNLISGNIKGVSVGGYSTVQGNFIGTDFSGSAAIPNQYGITLQSASYVLIGGTGTGQGNLISGNTGTGISIHDFATHIEVVHNKIGTDITGSGPLGNGRGVAIQGSGNFIGHVATGGGNTIAYNDNEGVMLTWSASQNRIEANTIHDNGVGIYAMDDTTSANPFTQNSIYANAALGIDLAPWGVNVNDPGDSDTGANQRLNYPVFTTLNTTSVSGTACHGCTVEVFRSDEDASGYGEGESLIGSVVAGPYGDFNITYPSPLAICDKVTATATDAFGNTSEFSPYAPVGLCLVLDPSWLFLIEVIIFIIIWFAARSFGRRAGLAAGPAAAAGGAAGVVAALGVFGLMAALPNVELNILRGGSPEAPEILPPCESFLTPGSMIPFAGAQGLPNDPDDPSLSWTPIGPEGQGEDVQWQVELIGPTGEIMSEVTDEHAIPLSAFGIRAEQVMDDGEHGDGAVMDDGEHGDGAIMDDGEHGDTILPESVMDDGEHGDGAVMDDGEHGDGAVMDDGEHGDTILSESVMDDGEHGDGAVMDDGEHGDLIGPSLMDDGEHGDSAGSVMDDGEHGDGAVMDDGEHGDTILSESVMDDGEHGDTTDPLGYDGVDGESQDSLMINDQDWDFEHFFWRLTGYTPSSDGSMQPFCRPTNWSSFQLGAPESLPPLPWLASAPPAPPEPSEPAPVDEGDEVPPEPCTPAFTAAMNLTCRSGPDSAYEEQGYLLEGESAAVEGRNADSTWWWIPNPDWQGHCWVWDGGGDAICIPEDLPEIAAPPLPTEEPPACRIDLDRDACIEAGGTYVDEGATAAARCVCPEDG